MRSKARRSAMWGRSLLILGAFLIFAAGAAFAGHGKLARDLRGKKSSDQVNVIVQFNQAPTTKHHKAVLKGGGKLRRELKLLRSGVTRYQHRRLPISKPTPTCFTLRLIVPFMGRQFPRAVPGPRVDYHTDAVQALSHGRRAWKAMALA